MIREQVMKKIFKSLLSVLFAVVMTSQGGAFATTLQELEEPLEEQKYNSDSDEVTLTFLKADLNLTLSRSDLSDHADSLVVFITNPGGRIVKNAQVVTTIIGVDGSQVMSRALPFKGAYLINTALLTPGQYHLEAEIITDGNLFTDEFKFKHMS